MNDNKELKLQIAQKVINTICPEKTMEEIYNLENLQTYNHVNCVTGHEYTGLNRYALELSMLLNGYELPQWATFNQFKQDKKHIIKGSKATKICVAIFNKKKDEQTQDEQTQEEKEHLNYFKGGSVFNVKQVESI